MDLATRRQIVRAFQDLLEGTRNWRIWFVLGIAETRQRYRRSMLGPFWITIAVGLQAFVMGYLLSLLFQTSINRQLPFICIGLVTWTFVTGTVNEGANSFISMQSVILQVKRPLWTYVILMLWRNAIIYAHTIGIFFVVAFAFGIYPSMTYLLLPVSLALLVVNMGWIALAAGIVSTRYRDVPLLISNLFNILMWLTPVFYEIDMLGPRARFVIELNPLTAIIEIARAPYLNSVPSASVWISALALAAFGWLFAFGLFARSRSRIPYWL
jgi:ABC-type polysaccharide/polyol phosphate export permease